MAKTRERGDDLIDAELLDGWLDVVDSLTAEVARVREQVRTIADYLEPSCRTTSARSWTASTSCTRNVGWGSG
jgi:hypothetical protein